ncbi:phosphate ABC transporter substrate-binding protein, PhoT family [Fulvimarina manganoxydans]|uniref:Phosphate ABC transporter substrate-binding protein, PhoT family n=1 Tax=Fulvimarina manganoxydans TaxID=937218 RepID=A0A1W2AVW7_9HYPH|nr:substrate-binding domain-containing protein [Fulvimarina manganoxydans]SMC64836.1 phosphate ABC transporter substrate-binding protein, PhoT family [Fulvimarina manganoxydans]
MNKTLLAGLVLASTMSVSSFALAQSNDQIQVAGSSTVLPYAQIVAENFGETFPDYPTPVVESGGSSAGLKQFCQGVGPDTIDVANASRAIKESEVEACKANGVNEIQEVKFGYDGIVFASSASGPDFKLNPARIFQALAAKVVKDGEVVDNSTSNWNAVDSSLPDQKITAFIPASNHGTREVFEEKVLIKGCEESGTLEAYVKSGMDEDAAEDQCKTVRTDGVVSEISGDYTETLARIEADQQAIGVFGLAFYEQNQDKLKVATINDVVPSAQTIATGEYPVSRPLYFYVKKAHIGVVPGLSEYVQFFLSDQMTGEGSPTVEYGLVPLSDEERQEQISNFENGVTLGS